MQFFVTGGSGYIGSACVYELLKQGFSVTATTRKPETAKKITSFWQQQGLDVSKLNWHYLDLMQSDGWRSAVEGSDVVLHVASPVLTANNTKFADVVLPALNGVANVFAASAGTSVKRIVMTSSYSAINGVSGQKVFDHTSWTDLASSDTGPYAYSKTYAELTAWSKIALIPEMPELVTILPAFVMGPPAYPTLNSTSINLISQIMYGTQPKYMRGCNFHYIALSDVVKLHIAAALNSNVKNKRLPCCAPKSISFDYIRQLLSQHSCIINQPRFTWPFCAIPSKYRRYQANDVIVDCKQTETSLQWSHSSVDDAIVAMAKYIKKFTDDKSVKQ